MTQIIGSPLRDFHFERCEKSSNADLGTLNVEPETLNCLDLALQYLQAIQAIDEVKLTVVRAKNVIALNRRLTFARHGNVIADFLWGEGV